MAIKMLVHTTTPVCALRTPEDRRNISGAADSSLPIERTETKWQLIGSLNQ